MSEPQFDYGDVITLAHAIKSVPNTSAWLELSLPECDLIKVPYTRVRGIAAGKVFFFNQLGQVASISLSQEGMPVDIDSPDDNSAMITFEGGLILTLSVESGEIHPKQGGEGDDN